MRVLFYLLVAGMLWSCSTPEPKDGSEQDNAASALPESGEMITIEFPSSDGLQITADYYPAEGSKKVIVLCHQAGFIPIHPLVCERRLLKVLRAQGAHAVFATKVAGDGHRFPQHKTVVTDGRD